MKTAVPQYFLIILSFILISCNKSFDSTKWKSIENGLYGENYRKKELSNLIDNQLKFPKSNKEKGTNKSDVIKLIGKPTKKDCDGYEVYEIEEKTGMIDPNGFVNLKLIYAVDSTLQGYIIEDGNYKE